MVPSNAERLKEIRERLTTVPAPERSNQDYRDIVWLIDRLDTFERLHGDMQDCAMALARERQISREYFALMNEYRNRLQRLDPPKHPEQPRARG